jgi:hypothetical protein
LLSIVARPLFGYRSAIHAGLLALTFGVLFLIRQPVVGVLDVTVMVLSAALLVLSLTSRIEFSDSEIRFYNPVGQPTAHWVLDGNASIEAVRRTAPQRWGRRQRLDTLELRQSDWYPGALGFPLLDGVYSRQDQWSEFLIRAVEDRQLDASPKALAALVRYADED